MQFDNNTEENEVFYRDPTRRIEEQEQFELRQRARKERGINDLIRKFNRKR